MKFCCRALQCINIEFNDGIEAMDVETIQYEMPVGHYFECEIQPPCGLAESENIIG
ncbi:MAG: hypothetical protein WBK54_04380 [Bacilli bacterium]|jgi:predicted transcriptional regulator|nr:hypothetical protein [Acholeplasmataceae bacterium]